MIQLFKNIFRGPITSVLGLALFFAVTISAYQGKTEWWPGGMAAATLALALIMAPDSLLYYMKRFAKRRTTCEQE
jgi:sterol desaturase/sphingolipid hydroxylase (fatty acid hydroxylase superfamily)